MCKDTQVIQVVLDGINNMLKMATEPGAVDALANLIEECGGTFCDFKLTYLYLSIFI
jgi:hypothetical protein